MWQFLHHATDGALPTLFQNVFKILGVGAGMSRAAEKSATGWRRAYGVITDRFWNH